ncbi:probable N-acetyltransferase HLS1 [Olea europaea subsp. europaea]|uniref:Probable N-acetyltransferase HLS1 n=1 Tax=Olea europaea subsp. europaea TaxID=158383 RepID=A0A8S0SW74_OLEEU|nr:probable N-acetyltransferase HLS1 [Olea europaea subsp. europaea]
MSSKIAAETMPNPGAETPLVVVREYDERRDKVAVNELERQCEVGQRGKPALVTDLMGDPICRLRYFASHVMLVAEYGNRKEVVGTIRGCIKTVAIGKRSSNEFPIYVKLAYVFGLRVSSAHRRLGIGTKLVQQLEEWCRQNGANYAYMATDGSNQPSLNLFTLRCNYVKFRNPTVLVQPVHLHYKPLGSVPNIFENFGFYFLYGLHMEGKDGSNLMKSLCAFAHNMARDDKDCRVLVAEVGQMDPVREAIPHWRKFSWDQDIWCIKKLREAQGEDNRNSQEYWIKSQTSSSVIFVDPRDN